MLTSHSALTLAASLLAGVAMLRVSLDTKMLSMRRPRRCPSCGRLPRGRACDCSSR